jgi:hypothetical protein
MRLATRGERPRSASDVGPSGSRVSSEPGQEFACYGPAPAQEVTRRSSPTG